MCRLKKSPRKIYPLYVFALISNSKHLKEKALGSLLGDTNHMLIDFDENLSAVLRGYLCYVAKICFYEIDKDNSNSSCHYDVHQMTSQPLHGTPALVTWPLLVVPTVRSECGIMRLGSKFRLKTCRDEFTEPGMKMSRYGNVL